MTSNEDEMKTGTVRTNRIGSDATFEICTRAEWDAMTEDEQHRALNEAAHESGVFEIYQND
jgi:hypothetical protein